MKKLAFYTYRKDITRTIMDRCDYTVCVWRVSEETTFLFSEETTILFLVHNKYINIPIAPSANRDAILSNAILPPESSADPFFEHSRFTHRPRSWGYTIVLRVPFKHWPLFGAQYHVCIGINKTITPIIPITNNIIEMINIIFLIHLY